MLRLLSSPRESPEVVADPPLHGLNCRDRDRIDKEGPHDPGKNAVLVDPGFKLPDFLGRLDRCCVSQRAVKHLVHDVSSELNQLVWDGTESIYSTSSSHSTDRLPLFSLASQRSCKLIHTGVVTHKLCHHTGMLQTS